MATEAIWIAAVRSGDATAFDAVVERYQGPITRYLRRLVGDTAQAEDLAQETFLKAYIAILRTDSTLALRPWLYQIATNEARMYFRRRRWLRFLPFLEERHDLTTPGPGERFAQQEQVQQALAQLPEGYTAPLLLYLVEGFKHAEVGQILGISAEAARKRVARGSQLFRQAYQQLEGREPGAL